MRCTVFRALCVPTARNEEACTSIDQVVGLTLALILLFPSDVFYYRLFASLVAATGIVFPASARTPVFWFALAVFNLTFQNLYAWAVSDNHEWLFSYWFLAIGCSLCTRHPAATLSVNARYLVGLTFLVATLRKLCSAEYMTGHTFQYLLIFDSRFYEVSRLVAGYVQTPQQFLSQMQVLNPIVELPSTNQLRMTAFALSVWTLLSETTIAALFLLKRPAAFAYWRHVLLLFFIATVYPVAPVIGFAWILLILGLACLPARVMALRRTYFALLALTYLCLRQQLKVLLCTWFFGREFYLPVATLSAVVIAR